MKKIISLLLVFVLTFSLMTVFCACDKDEKSGKGNSTGASQSTDKDSNDNNKETEEENEEDETTEDDQVVFEYNLIDIKLLNVKVSDYEYNWIKFDTSDFTYKLENKANDIVTTQSGKFTIDENGNVTITNDKNPAQNFFLYTGETARFEDDKLYLKAEIPDYGEVSLTYQEK